MVAAVRVHKVGGPEVLTFEEVEVPTPGPGQIRIKQRACGVNFIDAYFRMGMYPSPTGLPFIPGNEGAGEVVAVGPGVTDLKVGDRVAYVVTLGGYAAERVLPAERAVKLAPDINFDQAAGMMLRGLTACYLLRRTFKVEKGHNVLIHAAAGGVGLIACQWANYLGANVIGTVGSQKKAELAKANGCHHTILYRDEDFAARVKEITGGKLCDVVYDGIGKTTFPASLDCLRPLGMFVSFGSASGQIEAFNINILQTKGSLFTTRPTLNHYAAARADLLSLSGELFDVIKKGKVKIPINQEYPLEDAHRAHRELEIAGDDRLVHPHSVNPKPWGFWATLGFAVLAFGLGQAVATAGLAAWGGEDALGSGFRYDGSAIAIGALLANAVQIVTLMLAARLAGADAAEYLALDVPRPVDLVFGLFCLAALIVVGDTVTWLAGRDLVPPFQLDVYRSAQAQGMLVLLWLALIVAAPAGEEILFRGFMYRGWMQPPTDPRAVIVLIALIWSLLHIQYDWFGMLQVFVTGVLFGWLRWRSGSTTLLVLLHIGLNLEGIMETLLVLNWQP